MADFFTEQNKLMEMMRDYENTKPLKAIKMTTELYYYLTALVEDGCILLSESDSAQGYAARFLGTPIIIDNTIESPYELVY